ncbi:MAG: histidine kinase [Proteobacteria bacterium]|nr:histidine kinase [Pseudomonadota bacterium]
MPDDQSRRAPGRPLDSTTDFIRPNRPEAMAFVGDAGSEGAIREGFAEALSEPIDIRRGGIRAAIAAQQKAPTPRVLVVDVSGEDQPLMALTRLSEVVEPDTCVLVVGDATDLATYREITRGLGAAEYLPKPLTRDLVAQHFAPLARGQAPEASMARGGRFITFTGVRGGVGASVVAASVAWHLGLTLRRHTVLLDGDLHLGTAAFMLNTQPGPGLRAAIEAPERIDSLLAERAATPVADRLHVLSGQEKLTQEILYTRGAAAQLLEALSRRYNFIIGDLRWQPTPFCRELLAGAQHRVLVMAPTLASVRDGLRMIAGGGGQQRATIVLNRAGLQGGLKRAQVEDALKAKVDVVIPDLPRQIGNAVTMGDLGAAQTGAFRHAIQDLARQVGAADSAAQRALKPRLGGFGQIFGRAR